MLATRFQHGKKVLYVPNHAEGDIRHPDVESGRVSSCNDRYVFVRFDKHVAKLGWSQTTSQACLPDNLVLADEVYDTSSSQK